MKDVTNDDMLWVAVSKRLSRDFRMGEPSTSYVVLSTCEYIACPKADAEN